MQLKHIISFDIEDWFHPEIFAEMFSRKDWENLESRVKKPTELILNFLSRKNIKATFFYLGWVAEKFPELVEQTVSAGHEIASHGFSHQMITKLSPEAFRQDLRKSLQVLNSLSPEPVTGFRAPTFSVTKETLWALPIMHEEGIRYDSSVFPIHHDRYGIPDAPRTPYVIYRDGNKSLLEYPMTTATIGAMNLPCAGGGYFRLYPFALSLKLMKKCETEGRQIIFYAHPWEFDTNLPRVDLGTIRKLRHYTGIKKFLERLDKVTDHFEFTAFREVRKDLEVVA